MSSVAIITKNLEDFGKRQNILKKSHALLIMLTTLLLFFVSKLYFEQKLFKVKHKHLYIKGGIEKKNRIHFCFTNISASMHPIFTIYPLIISWQGWSKNLFFVSRQPLCIFLKAAIKLKLWKSSLLPGATSTRTPTSMLSCPLGTFFSWGLHLGQSWWILVFSS